MKHQLLIIFIIFILGGCATHPTVSTTPMAQGEKRYGWSWSAENVFPYLWYRYGLSDKNDISKRKKKEKERRGEEESRSGEKKDKKRGLLYTYPSPRDATLSRMPSSA